MPSKPFAGVTDGLITPLGQVRLAVTFGTRENYRTELVDFNVAHIGLPYNAILGYPALAKFMAVTHHAYNLVKLPGCRGIIESACVAPCVVLVINDNPYGLMFALRYTCRSCP